MSFFETISIESKKRDLRYLVIGGLAVNSYGYSRATGDLDILIHRDNKGGRIWHGETAAQERLNAALLKKFLLNSCCETPIGG